VSFTDPILKLRTRHEPALQSHLSRVTRFTCQERLSSASRIPKRNPASRNPKLLQPHAATAIPEPGRDFRAAPHRSRTGDKKTAQPLGCRFRCPSKFATVVQATLPASHRNHNGLAIVRFPLPESFVRASPSPRQTSSGADCAARFAASAFHLRNKSHLSHRPPRKSDCSCVGSGGFLCILRTTSEQHIPPKKSHNSVNQANTRHFLGRLPELPGNAPTLN